MAFLLFVLLPRVVVGAPSALPLVQFARILVFCCDFLLLGLLGGLLPARPRPDGGRPEVQAHDDTPNFPRVFCTYLPVMCFDAAANAHRPVCCLRRDYPTSCEHLRTNTYTIHRKRLHARVRAASRCVNDDQVKLTEGDYTNLKLTTPEDLVIAAQILEARRIGEYEDGVADDDDEDEKESISMIRADEKWTDDAHPVGDFVEDEKESISQLRANEKWTEPAAGGSSDSYDEPMVNLSMLRADSS